MTLVEVDYKAVVTEDVILDSGSVLKKGTPVRVRYGDDDNNVCGIEWFQDSMAHVMAIDLAKIEFVG